MQQQPGQYDFIMNGGGNASRRPGLPVIGGGGSSSAKSRILIVVIGVVFLVMIATGVNALLNSGPDNKEQLLGLAQQQTELIRVADIGVKKSTGLQAKNLAVTTEFAIKTERNTLMAALKSQKVKINEKTLAATRDAKRRGLR